MVHITDVKIVLMEQVADDYDNLAKCSYAKCFFLFLWLYILLISTLCYCISLCWGNVVRVTLDHTGSYVLSQ